MDKKIFLDIVKPFTMTTDVRIEVLFDSLEEIRDLNLEGDLVECGVWKGGNILGIIRYLEHHKIYKKVWLYDTFEGMINPGVYDVDYSNSKGEEWIGKCDSDLESVKKLMEGTNYPKNLINFVKGDICQTLLIKENIPEKICLLRLDTDWYESTKIELEILYPSLVKDGILIVDDYGHWKGCKKAVDEYFGPELRKEDIDYTCVRMRK